MSKIRVSKTTYWKTENGNVIHFEDLPSAVLQQIEIYDAIREDLTDIKYQEQVYTLALATKRQQIEAILTGITNAREQQSNKNDVESETASQN